MTGLATMGFDIDKAAKRFYERFRKEHGAFLKSIAGIASTADLEWYASVMLNRLMFVYFIQKKGFLDGDPDYLRNRLRRVQQKRGRGPFISFYRCFLLRLFHEGFGRSERPPEPEALLGAVPYINCGIFLPHPLEEKHRGIDIPDGAFERIFDFFDQYKWPSDDRPLSADKEINPHVLGYILENYVNRKQMGAYYTKEDITEYISGSTILPFIIDEAAAFKEGRSIWRLLRKDPDRYIYETMRKGREAPLPSHIEEGIYDARNRSGWNRPAPREYALPTETWREVTARRKRCGEIRDALVRGKVASADDLITYNLDIRRFAQDMIESCEEPDLLRAIYGALRRVTILDPTCGSGAFLLAALDLLQPLYEACLHRMRIFLKEAKRDSNKHKDFREILDRADSHPSLRYFICKSIIVNNLYGVDIMEEAVEICKLRLLLKLVAHVERIDDVEPMPDGDFNIRAGNALVGYASPREVKNAIARGKDGPFLNLCLAGEYGVDENSKEYETWLASHRPFHWFVEFNSIMKRGGFDVIIGNPPYVESRKVRSPYGLLLMETESTGNLYAPVVERSLRIARRGARIGMIVPIASLATGAMKKLQNLYMRRCTRQWHAHFATRPGKLFAGVDMNLTITLLHAIAPDKAPRIFSTSYYRWRSGAAGDRESLFQRLQFIELAVPPAHPCPFPKLGTEIELSILAKLHKGRRKLSDYYTTDGEPIYYHSGGRYWRKALQSKLSSHYKEIRVDRKVSPVAFALLNSQLFYWYWIANSNCMDVVSREVDSLPVFDLRSADAAVFSRLRSRLMSKYESSREIRARRGAVISTDEINFDVGRCKPVIDEIDTALALCYGLTAEEIDFLINYDIKYRIAS